ncbi:MAG: hypothetical protein ACM3SS_04025 [Rhodospirillaceae bacterium]
MNTPVEFVSSWQISLSADGQQIVLQPWVGKPGQAEIPAQHFALTLPIARMLQRQLAESIRVLEQHDTDMSGESERRKTQQPVARDRRKARHFEGSPSAHADGQHASDQAERARRDPEE